MPSRIGYRMRPSSRTRPSVKASVTSLPPRFCRPPAAMRAFTRPSRSASASARGWWFSGQARMLRRSSSITAASPKGARSVFRGTRGVQGPDRVRVGFGADPHPTGPMTILQHVLPVLLAGAARSPARRRLARAMRRRGSSFPRARYRAPGRASVPACAPPRRLPCPAWARSAGARGPRPSRRSAARAPPPRNAVPCSRASRSPRADTRMPGDTPRPAWPNRSSSRV